MIATGSTLDCANSSDLCFTSVKSGQTAILDMDLNMRIVMEESDITVCRSKPPSD